MFFASGLDIMRCSSSFHSPLCSIVSADMHREASSPSGVSAFAGQASMHRRHPRHMSVDGRSGSISRVVRISVRNM